MSAAPLAVLSKILPVENQQRLEQDLMDLIGRFDRSDDSTMIVPAEYAEIVVVKK